MSNPFYSIPLFHYFRPVNLRMTESLRIIISGGPGTGKSTLLNLLRDKGYSCHDEVARMVIKEQLEKNSKLLPWQDLMGYSNLVFERIVAQTKLANQSPISIFDRSAVDVLAYLSHGKQEIPEYMRTQISELAYHKTVFFAPFWSAIYQEDGERKETPHEAAAISLTLMKIYQSFGFELIELPLAPPQQRLEIIEDTLKLLMK